MIIIASVPFLVDEGISNFQRTDSKVKEWWLKKIRHMRRPLLQQFTNLPSKDKYWTVWVSFSKPQFSSISSQQRVVKKLNLEPDYLDSSSGFITY